MTLMDVESSGCSSFITKSVLFPSSWASRLALSARWGEKLSFMFLFIAGTPVFRTFTVG
ncbi:hypothetical protein D3C75_1185330 [compost metagenome]